MNQEIEKKYLLKEFPEELVRNGQLRIVSRKTIEQTYLALTDSEEIRIRRLTSEGADGSRKEGFTHTYKRGNGLAREEAEYEIGRDIYTQLLGASGRVPLVKTRTKVDWNGQLFEIDDYSQFNLMTVEVEFASVEEAESFEAPPWFGPEVGSELEYRNKKLWASVQQGGK